MSLKNTTRQNRGKNSKSEPADTQKDEKLTDFFNSKDIPLVYRLVYFRSLCESSKQSLNPGSLLGNIKNSLASEAKLLQMELW